MSIVQLIYRDQGECPFQVVALVAALVVLILVLVVVGLVEELLGKLDRKSVV